MRLCTCNHHYLPLPADWRVTLVPCIVIPALYRRFLRYVSGRILHQCAFHARHRTIGGLVVDDAIVMTENIYIRIEKGMTPKEAGIEGAKEISLPLFPPLLRW